MIDFEIKTEDKEFEAKLKTVTVEKENETGEFINS